MQRVIEQDILVHDEFSSSLDPATTSSSLTPIPVARPNPTTPPCTPMTHGNRLSQSSSLPAFHSSISFGYDAFSRMTGITNGAVSVEYTYDSLGRKVKRVKRDTTIYPDSTYYVYDGLDPVCVIRFNPASTECTTVTWLLRGLGVAPGIGNIVAQQRYTINFSGTMSQPVTHYYT